MIFVFQFLVNTVFAQTTIWGAVQDSTGKPLKSVSIRLVVDQDTFYQITDLQGKYKFHQGKVGDNSLIYSMLGYKTEQKSVRVAQEEVIKEVPLLVMEPFSTAIPFVHVLKVVPIVKIGDTTQFNFDAFKFRPRSLLWEALRQLPGFQVTRDGTVSYNGQVIRKVKVDNKDFFGGDMLTATQNLPADFIKNLQLLDYKDDVTQETGMLSTSTEKIININLREDSKKIHFGQVTGGGGTNDRYLGSFGMNRYDNGAQLSVSGSLNNTNTNLYSYENQGGAVRERRTMEYGDYQDPVDGLNTVSSLGASVSDKLSKRTSFNASYNYVRRDNRTDGNSRLTSSYIGNTITRNETYKTHNRDQVHKAKFDTETRFNNNDLLKIGANFTLSKSISYNDKSTEVNNYKVKNNGGYRDSIDQYLPNGELQALYSKHFNKKGRRLVGTFWFSGNSLERDERVKEKYEEFSALDTVIGQFEQRQKIYQRNQNTSTKASVSYVEPFFENSFFEFSYEFELNKINSAREVYERLGKLPTSGLDSLLNMEYNYMFRSNRTSLTYQYEPNKKFKMNAGFAVQPVLLRGNQLNMGVDYTYDNINLVPTANILYKFSKEMDWQLGYKGKNNQPYFNQIAPLVDNTNSRNVIVGNPELKAEFAHSFTTTFRRVISSTMQNFETSFAFNMIANKIVSDKSSAPNSTTQTTTFKNADGYFDWRWHYGFNTPFIHESIQLDLIGDLDYYNNLSFIDQRKRTTTQLLFNQSAQFRFQLGDYLESILNANYVLNKTEYSIPFRTKFNVETLFLGLGAKGYVSDNFSLGFDMSQRYNSGYANSFMNVNQTIMNGFLELTCLPNKSLLLRLQGYDLFNQNKDMGIYSEYIGNDVYEARNNRLGRYFMLSLNMRLQNFHKKK
ncbi:outer membrane beta-barrel protein [Sphingobacterium sp. Mn56C]|uniref:outer membrane beta-barrel protein n=1 Tax=Sphingobacterium sp. Mn56C TaxID=3395261 RepID=UPI003BC64365